MNLSAKVKGVGGAQKEVRTRVLGVKERVSKAVRAGLEKIKERSADYVPVEKGALRRSRRVVKKRNETHGQVVYGNDQVPYALIVHEVPPPPEKSPGGKSFTHDPPTQYKYLEKAAEELESEVRQDIRDAAAGKEVSIVLHADDDDRDIGG